MISEKIGSRWRKGPHIAASLCGFIALFCALPALAQPYPSRPIRFIVPFPPGGSTDTYARIVSRKLAESLGQSIVIDNRPGAGGALGAELAAKAVPDGYTIWIGQDGNLALGPAMRPTNNYDPVRDFAPISLLVKTPQVIAVNEGSPFASLKDLVAAAKKAPGTLTYGSAGLGTTGHILGVFFNQAAGIEVTHVPYKGAAPAMFDLRGGRISYLATSMPAAVQFAKEGRIRILATSGRQRARVMPDIPTVAESGYPNFETIIWHGVLAPARTPRDVIARLNREIVAVLAMPDVQKLLLAEGGELSPSTPAEFAAFVKSEVAKWAQVIKRAGITAE
jgi:tripartite-type tricarboxylate transporter receptor subunit TctC